MSATKKLTANEKRDKAAIEFIERILPYMRVKEQEPVKITRAELKESIRNKALNLQGFLDSFIYGYHFTEELIEMFIKRSNELSELLSGKPIKIIENNQLEPISILDFFDIVKGLSKGERDVFDIMVMCETKEAVYRNAFHGDPYDKAMWKIVHSLEKNNLIKIIRNSYDKVIKFETVNILDDLIDEKGNETVNILDDLIDEKGNETVNILDDLIDEKGNETTKEETDYFEDEDRETELPF
jgi:hypothetical protein